MTRNEYLPKILWLAAAASAVQKRTRLKSGLVQPELP